MLIHPIIMSGGSGTRLWPISRALYPKQFLKLTTEHTLLQDAVLRVSDAKVFAAPIIICAEEHRFMIAEQLRELNIKPHAILLEPTPRSTAAVAALAAQFLVPTPENPDPLFLLMPTDHAVGNVAAFVDACKNAALAATDGYLTTFGVKPQRAETGYGYIKPGDSVGAGSVCSIALFVEKPDSVKAQEFVKQGYLWNSGMFLFSVRSVAEELNRLQPEIMARVHDALHKAVRDLDFIRLDKDTFSKVPAVSIDVGLMERTRKAAVVPVDMAWNDIGSWQSMWDIAKKDDAGNVAKGDVLLHDTKNSYVHSEGRLTVTLGTENLVIITMDDVVMVADMARAQDVKLLVDKLKADKREEVQHARRVYRPWGWYESLGEGERFQVKRIMVQPGRKLSLQSHHHRSEHWVVVEGTALVTKDDQEIFIHENESIYLPVGAKHRLQNPGKLPLMVVEVQSGSYLGEDDIVRFEDTYGRS
ncbi:MAG: mannose-1-phosphate guanylyltransferase/mannose-6-phosphate isomerase [Alphaproteobacteria bacterium]|nr:mannose-1-phosphate guanylyltransferase/mannose-6-phosphate isomerase [Alphaproteobacteria bacterium]